jgi:hypothetical protein
VRAARSRRWRRSGCNNGEQWWRAVRAGGRAAWQGEDRASMGWGSAAQTLGHTWHEERRREGGGCATHGRRGRRGGAEKKQRRRGAGGRRRGPVCNFLKVQGLLCKA